MKTFSSLLEREVIFTHPDGGSFPVELLPIRFFDEYERILKETERDLSSLNIVKGRKDLRTLISHVWPKEKEELLFHFDYPGLCNVARILFFGEESTYQKIKAGEKKKKEKPPKEMDLSLIAGRIMHTFPQYDIERLADLTFPIFLELDSLAFRIQADEALSLFIPAIAAGMGTEGIMAQLERIRETPPETHKKTKNYSYSQEEMEKAIARLKSPQKGKVIQEVKAGKRIVE